MKLRWKLSLGLGLIVLLTTAVVGLLVMRWTEEISLRDARRSLAQEAFLLRGQAARTLARGNSEQLQAQVLHAGKGIGTRFTVIRLPDGVVLADSHTNPGSMSNHANRPEVLDAVAKGRGTSIRFSHTVQTRMLYLALPVSDAAQAPRAVVRAAMPLSELDRRQARVRDVAIVGSLLALLVALVPGYLFARSISEPLERMTGVVRSFGAGDQPQPNLMQVPRGEGEISTLASAFNAMTVQLQERMQTTEAERAKLRAILSSMVEGVVAVDPQERVVHMNEVAGELLSTDPDTSIGLRIWDVTRMRAVCTALSRTLESAAAGTEEVTLAASPRDRILELHAAPLRGPEGRVAGALVVIHDVTELRRLEAVRRDFVANVSHELKTPLTAIRGQVETLLDVPEDGMTHDQRQRFLEKARTQAERLSTIVRDLLVLSRIETQKTTVEREAVDLRRPINDSLRQAREAAEAKGQRLEVSLPEEPLVVEGDREYLRQVVDNLLNNAVMYTPGEGTIGLRLRAVSDHAVLEVEDSGIGIAAADRARIFERFYRVDKGRSRDLGGTGLGLAIVKHIVHAHTGEVEVESVLGKGTTFRVKLPLSPKPLQPKG